MFDVAKSARCPSLVVWAAVVKLSQIRTLPVERIGNVIDILPPEVLSKLIDGLNEIIG